MNTSSVEKLIELTTQISDIDCSEKETILNVLKEVIDEEDKQTKKQESELAELALNFWRLSNWVNKTNVERKMQANSALRKIGIFLEKNGIELKDLLGQKYDDGYAADVMGDESDGSIPEDELIVVETVRPIILRNGTVIKYGQVKLGTVVKETIINEELPKDPEVAIPIIQKNIEDYCSSDYKDKKIVRKLRWCKEKLDKWLRNWGKKQ